MSELQIIYKDISELNPYENNPRLNDEAVKYVTNSIKEFGFKVPIIIDSNNVIIAGHTRLKAAKQLGMDKVPCIIASDLTEEQVKAFRLADNKVSEQSKWDNEKLTLELNDILDIDMQLFNFDTSMMNDINYIDNNIDCKLNERERTFNAYNLNEYNANKVAGFYQMPILKSCKYVPDDLIGFNYVLSKSPIKNTGVHFYLDDYQLERIWTNPLQYLDKLAEWDCVFTPDFSLYTDMPMAMKIWNVYRSRLIGQLLQNMGVNVIPTLQWAEKETFKFCFDGIEPNGVVSVSTIGVKRDSTSLAIWENGMDEAINILHPNTVLVYGGDIGYKFPCKAIYYNNNVLENIKSKSR